MVKSPYCKISPTLKKRKEKKLLLLLLLLGTDHLTCKGGGMVFCFVQKFVFRQNELEYLFFLSGKALIFFPEFKIRLYDKNSESDFFFPPPKSE